MAVSRVNGGNGGRVVRGGPSWAGLVAGMRIPVHYDAGVVIRAPRAAAIRKNATVATLCPHAAPVGPGCGRLHPLLGIHATPLTTSTEEHDGSSYVHHRG